MRRILAVGVLEGKHQPDLTVGGSCGDSVSLGESRGGRMTRWKGVLTGYAADVAPATQISSRTLYWALATGVALGCATADAADRYWDANGTMPGYGGSGDWSLTAPGWSPNDDGVSGPYGAWVNGALDDAIFGGIAGTVTLTDPITVTTSRSRRRATP